MKISDSKRKSAQPGGLPWPNIVKRTSNRSKYVAIHVHIVEKRRLVGSGGGGGKGIFLNLHAKCYILVYSEGKFQPLIIAKHYHEKL